MSVRDHEDEYDDLADESATDEKESDESYEDENWDEDESAEEAPPPKKKGRSSNLMIIGLGVLAFVGFMYFKFASAPVPEGANPPPVAAQVPAQAEDPVQIATGVEPPPMGQAEAPPIVVPDATPGSAEEPPAFTSAESSPPIIADLPEPQFEETQVTPTSPGTDSTSTAPSEPNLSAVVPEIQGQGVPAFSPSAEVSGSPAEPSGVAQTPPSVPGDRIQKLEAELANLRQTIVTQPMPESRQLAEISAELTALSDRLARLERTGIAAREDKGESPSSERISATRRFAPAAAPAPVRKSKYTLRAVSQGKAYLSPSGRSELLTVQVGDQVEGLGRIERIAQENNHWVVIGTMGRVRQ